MPDISNLFDDIDLSRIAKRRSPDWSIPKEPSPGAAVEPTRALFPQRPVIMPVVVAPVIPPTPPKAPEAPNE